jgi:hypothetical protein
VNPRFTAGRSYAFTDAGKIKPVTNRAATIIVLILIIKTSFMRVLNRDRKSYQKK